MVHTNRGVVLQTETFLSLRWGEWISTGDPSRVSKTRFIYGLLTENLFFFELVSGSGGT